MSYRGVCEACHRTSSNCDPAPQTPLGEELSNLYCPACHAAGRAVYPRPSLSPFDVAVNTLLAGLLVFVLAFVVAFGAGANR